ncbi:MAG: aminopeptidase P family protein [Clostridiaceae bacterium]|jgi:Xaa-Pro aminopeptidase|nr:aminopeptidase P family protein [Clostridiaceae bacterium]
MNADIREYRLPVSFFSNNRKRLLEKLPKRCCVVVFAGETVSMSDGAEYHFRPDRNFYYLAGVEQPDSVLVIRSDESRTDTSLFVHSNDPLRERWSGKRLTPAEVLERSGADEVFYLENLDDALTAILDDRTYDIATDKGFRTGPASRFLERARQSRGEESVRLIAPILARMRMKKQPCEIDMIKKAIELTDLSIRDALVLLRSETSELRLFSAMNSAMSRSGCLEPAFPTIVAAGENAFYLHHSEPDGAAIPKGVMIQIDVGATVGGLCADVSRAYPSSGVFSARQAALYDAVLNCLDHITRMIRPGVTIADINKIFRETASKALGELGILSGREYAEPGDYLWHNAAHHLGMDVHDACIKDLPIEANAVLAIEPGIYVREWGMGFRIEDDVLVTEEGCEVLSSFIFRDRLEVEELLGMSGGM